MGLFDGIFKKKQHNLHNSDSADINSFVIEWDNKISKKCNYGDDLNILTKYERVFFVTQELEREVNNGGFSQYFYNSSGNLAMELVNAFTEIGAFVTADICKKAISVFGERVPSDRDTRVELLDEMDEMADELFTECDNAFYEYTDDLTELNYAYIVKNKMFFT